MKHYILHILAMSMLIMSTSCVKEMSGVSPSGDEGEITLSLDVSTGKMPDVIVKNSWADNDAAERAVYNLRIYVFSYIFVSIRNICKKTTLFFSNSL